MKQENFSHIDSSGNPQMVDVSEKAATRRSATARALVRAGSAILEKIRDNELMTKKGPVFQTAIIAGIAGAKKTSELIPLCHPLGLEDCRISITVDTHVIVIDATAVVTAKTGVEMEALTAAATAALTVYDMCKAMSHDIVISEIKLMEKTGGKSDFRREEK